MSSNEPRNPLPSREAQEIYKRWIEHLDLEFTKHRKPELRAELVRDTLHQLLLGRPHGGRLNFTLTSELPFNVLQLSLDSINITLDAEYDQGVDEEKYAERKPLIWFWLMLDRSPIALNEWLCFRLRAMLGKHIFKGIGKNVTIYHGVEFRFGYNLIVEDDCVIHKHAMLNDEQELRIARGTVVGEYAVLPEPAERRGGERA